MPYWLYRGDRHLDASAARSLLSPGASDDGDGLVFFWAGETGLLGYLTTRDNYWRGIGRFLTIPVPPHEVYAEAPSVKEAINSAFPDQFLRIAPTTGETLKRLVNEAEVSAGNYRLDNDTLSGRARLSGQPDRRVPKALETLLNNQAVPPTPGAWAVLWAAAGLAMDYPRHPGEFSTIQLLIGMVESHAGGPDYGLKKHEREALQALAAVVIERPSYQHARAVMTTHHASPPRLSDLSGKKLRITTNVHRTINDAAQLAAMANLGAFDVTHLIRAFLDNRGGSGQLPKWLSSIDLTEDLLAEQYEARLNEQIQGGQATFTPHSDHIEVDQDRPDLLGIDHDAETLARFIASRQTEPPLAVGLFGDWGHGKSFFAKKVKHHIGRLSERARDFETRNNAKAPYHAHVCHVEFNAWHYIEMDLWASLVDHIVTSLNNHLKADPGDRERHAKLVDDLGARKGEEEEAKRKLEEAQQDCLEAEDELNDAKSELEGHEAARKEIEFDWQAIWQKAHAELMAGDALPAKIKEACADLGIADVSEDAKNLQEIYVLANGGLNIWSQLWRKVRDNPFFSAQYIAFGVLCLGLAYLMLGWEGLIAGAGLATAFGTATIKLLLNRLVKAGTTLTATYDQVMALTKIEQTNSELQLAEIGRRHAEAMAKVQAASERHAQAETARIQAQAALDAERPDERMRSFFAERLASNTYKKHLGLVATIRHDFEMLSRLLAEMPDRRLEEKEWQKRQEYPQLERIVLYIDDLDRCPPKTVLKVLQAVHLLLAYKLFVVVVAVDVRWLMLSLKDQHDFLAKADEAASPTSEAASTVDYLEKIFQVPFWVRPMEADTAQSYVGKLLGEGAVASTASPQKAAALRAPEIATGGDTTVPLPIKGAKRAPMPEGGTAAPNTPVPARDAPLFVLEQNAEEIALARRLAPYLGGSPRRSKRFANLYLLIKMGLDGQDRAEFVGLNGANPHYRCVMVLLALITGAPRHGKAVLSAITGAHAAARVTDILQVTGDALDSEHARCILAELSQDPPSLADLQRWAPVVGRHLFWSHTAEASAVPSRPTAMATQ